VNTLGTLRVASSNGAAIGQDDVWGKRGQFRREFADVAGISPAPTGVDPHVTAVDPAQLLHRLHESHQAGPSWQIVCGKRHEHADVPHSLALLRARRERPSRRRAAEKRDELAAPHPSSRDQLSRDRIAR
jgi:hypothetical protein